MCQVLLNLAALALHKRDGKRALQCCEEVLEQQGTASADELTQTLIQKAMLRFVPWCAVHNCTVVPLWCGT
jgi:hypothetical protein